MENQTPIEMLIWCPECGQRHIDEGEFATKPHHTHACQHCGHVWRQAIVPTVGVKFLPRFKEGDSIASITPETTTDSVKMSFSQTASYFDVVKGDLLDIDSARAAVFNAVRAIRVGSPSDDKLIVEELHKAGFGICLLPK